MQRFFCLLSISALCMALQAFANEAPKGWQWYNTPKKAAQHQQVKPKPKGIAFDQLNAKEQVAVLHYITIEAVNRVTLYPTEENARRAIILQNFWANHASRVTQVWKQAMLNNPSLDYTVSHPTENNAVPLELAKKRALENKAIAHFAKENALFFYYRGNNTLDQLLAKNVIRFCGEHQLRLVGISMDGKLIAGIKINAANNGKAESLHLKAIPALVLVNTQSRAITPIHYGYVTDEELAHRFLQVAQDFKGDL